LKFICFFGVVLKGLRKKKRKKENYYCHVIITGLSQTHKNWFKEEVHRVN